MNPRSTAGYRYGGVFLITLALLVFEIVQPNEDWARAVAVGLQGLALLVVVATSRASDEQRRERSRGLTVAVILVLAGIATGVIPDAVAALISGALAAAVPILLTRGLVRLVRERGVTVQAIAGGLAIYLSVGLVFAWAISFIAVVDGAAYFTQGGDGSPGDRVYFSFTSLTTTGYGDFAPATAAGHAVAVLEMLVGQLYLVTVIGVLVGRVVGGAARAMR